MQLIRDLSSHAIAIGHEIRTPRMLTPGLLAGFAVLIVVLIATLGVGAAQAIVVTNVGTRTMDGMRAIVARMEAREDRLLAARSAQAAQSYRVAVWTRLAATGLALLAMVGLFAGTLQFGADRQRA